MPINQTANLLAYFNQNQPASSQTSPAPAMTYPPIGTPGAISSTNVFSDAYSTGFTTGFTAGQPSKYVGIDASGTSMSQPLIPANGVVNYFSNTFAVGFQTQMQSSNMTGISGTPGSMTFANQGSALASTVPFTPTAIDDSLSPTTVNSNASPLDALVGNVATPSNNITQNDFAIPKVLGEVNYFTNIYAPGFTSGRGTLDPTQFKGVTGVDGTMLYTPPTQTLKIADSNNYNATSRYSKDTSRFEAVYKSDSPSEHPIDTNHLAFAREQRDPVSLYEIYKKNNYSSVKTKFESFVKPYVTRGIQMDNPNYTRVEGIPDSADEHLERLTLAIDGSTWMGGFKNRRKKMQLFQMQSRFQLGLGVLPLALLPLGHPYRINQSLDLRKTDILSLASAKAWIIGGTIARVPYSLTNYGVQNNLFFKYGLGTGKDSAIWDGLRKLKDKVLEAPADDLIPFHFKYLHRGPTAASTFGNFLQMRGTVKTMSHSVTPQWNTNKYFGRPDSTHTYSSFDENLSFSFQLYAAGRNDLLPLYKNLEALMDLCKPSWNRARTYMTGPVTELTIGDYVKDQPGFLKSLSISPDEQVYWDLGKDPTRGLPQIAQVVPQGLIDSVLPKILGGNLGRTDMKIPRAFNINVNYQYIQKDLPDANGVRRWSTDVMEDPGRWIQNWL